MRAVPVLRVRHLGVLPVAMMAAQADVVRGMKTAIVMSGIRMVIGSFVVVCLAACGPDSPTPLEDLSAATRQISQAK